MKFLILLFPLIACAMAPKLPKPSPSDHQYAVQPKLIGQKQEHDQWCAAASARMLMSQFTKNLPSQCQIVSRVTGKPCVNRTIDAGDALRAYGYSVQELPVTFYSVVHSINSNRPVIIYHYNRAGSSDGSTHAVVAYATYNTKERDYIMTYNPLTNTTETIDSSYVVGNLAWYRAIRIN